MKRVFDYIATKSCAFASEPLFAYLDDRTIEPRDKLRLVPWAAHFIMSFADLCRFVFPTASPSDRYETLINQQLEEEAFHWRWYLTDLTKLGMDPKLPYTDAIRALWSEQTIDTRRVSYELCKLWAGLDSVQRLVMIQAMEATGRITIGALTRVGVELEGQLDDPLAFFGRHHLESENAHTLEDDAIRKSLEAIELDDTARAALVSVVDRVFEHFRGFADDSMRIAREGLLVGERPRELR